MWRAKGGKARRVEGTTPVAGGLLKRTESHQRAIVKAVTWRAIGTLDTFVLGYLITGHPGHAGAIASLETFTKVFLYYLHERAWRLIRWAPDAHLRSFLKACSWRFVGSMDTFLLSLLVTGRLRYAVSIAGTEVLTKIFLYYLHERAWRLVPWGRLEVGAAKAEPAASKAALV